MIQKNDGKRVKTHNKHAGERMFVFICFLLFSMYIERNYVERNTHTAVLYPAPDEIVYNLTIRRVSRLV